jgi:hypothetical protein
VPAPRPTPDTAKPAALLDSTATPVEANVAVGVVDKIDRVKRVFTLKTTMGPRTFGFRDDTTFEVVAGVKVRLDEYVETRPESLPFAEQERVRVKWRQSSSSDVGIATDVAPSKP